MYPFRGYRILGLAGLLGLLLRFRRHEPYKLFCVLWLFMGLATVVVQNKFYTYHYLIVYPPLILMAALTLSELEKKWKWRPRRLALRCLAGGILAFLMTPLNYAAFNALATGHRLGPGYYQSFSDSVNNPFELSREVAAYLRERTAPGDTIQVWGWNNLIYFLSGRRAASRYGFIAPLAQACDNRQTAVLQNYCAEFLDNLRRNNPKYIVIADNDRNNLTLATSSFYLTQKPFSEIRDYFQTHYRDEIQMGIFRICRLKQ